MAIDGPREYDALRGIQGTGRLQGGMMMCRENNVRAMARGASASFLFCLALGTTNAVALTQIDFISDPGDYIGGGQTFSLTPADGAFTVTNVSGSGFGIDFLGNVWGSPKTFWTVGFAPIRGLALTTGNYPSAQRWPIQSPTHPGLSIYGDGRGCNQSIGKFTVYEAMFDSNGQLFAFAADAEQHCEGATPALTVRVRYNSDVPMLLSAPQSMPGLRQEVYASALVTLDGSQSYDPDGQIVAWHWSQISGPPVKLTSRLNPVVQFRTPKVPLGGADIRLQLDVADNDRNRASGTVDVHVFNPKDRRTMLTLVSPPGDYIGGGVSQTITLADAEAKFGLSAGLPTVDVEFLGGAFLNWSTFFEAPNGATLLPGTYLNAARWPFQSIDQPGLSIYGDGRGCNTLTGQFRVYECDPTATPPRFSATFSQSCEAFMPALTGTVLFNAVAPSVPKARVSAPRFAAEGSIVTLDGSDSSSSGSTLVAHRWRQLSGPTIASNHDGPRLTFVMPQQAHSPLRFELEVTDASGLVDVEEVEIVNE
jgi:K319-like protein